MLWELHQVMQFGFCKLCVIIQELERVLELRLVIVIVIVIVSPSGETRLRLVIVIVIVIVSPSGEARW